MTVRFSSRTDFEQTPNALTRRRAELEREGRELIDLTVSNPTACGLEVLSPALPVVREYEPEPRGLGAAREAVARLCRAPDQRPCDVDHVVLSASTSEAYGWLFKLLCEPGDEVLVPAPCYPLFDFLTRLEGVGTLRYPLGFSAGRWELDVARLEAAGSARTRAVLAVSPANPTGHLLAPEELEPLAQCCARRGWALIVDEVFHDPARHGPLIAGRSLPCLTFGLGGLSKLAGLPQLKLAWTVVSGPERLVEQALARLDVIADTSLSVASAVQRAAPELIAKSPAFLRAVAERVATNARTLAARRTPGASWDCLPFAGGWTQVLRIGELPGEEPVCLSALERGVVVQPGYFYDFPAGAWLVVSLLPEPARFAEGAARLAAVLG